ncbi:MAG TPA: transcriptional regulator [Candidatus Sulfotelmatobacter sp.]|nr:transcriptional regulator [Candidatus Sulfotelmatobacter sp.]
MNLQRSTDIENVVYRKKRTPLPSNTNLTKDNKLQILGRNPLMMQLVPSSENIPIENVPRKDDKRPSRYSPDIDRLVRRDPDDKEWAQGEWARWVKFLTPYLQDTSAPYFGVPRDDPLILDGIQTTWEKIIKAIGKGQKPRYPNTWAVTILRKSIRDTLRTRNREVLDPMTSELFTRDDRQANAFEDDIDNQDEIRRLLPFIQKLPQDHQRQIWFLMEGLTPPEIAQRTGLPLGTAKTQRMRAIARLRTLTNREPEVERPRSAPQKRKPKQLPTEMVLRDPENNLVSITDLSRIIIEPGIDQKTIEELKRVRFRKAFIFVREYTHITGKSLGEAIGKTPWYIREIETGKREPSVTEMQRILNMINVEKDPDFTTNLQSFVTDSEGRGILLSKLRKAVGLSEIEVGEIIGVTRNPIRAIENGEKSISDENTRILAQIFQERRQTYQEALTILSEGLPTLLQK